MAANNDELIWAVPFSSERGIAHLVRQFPGGISAQRMCSPGIFIFEYATIVDSEYYVRKCKHCAKFIEQNPQLSVLATHRPKAENWQQVKSAQKDFSKRMIV